MAKAETKKTLQQFDEELKQPAHQRSVALRRAVDRVHRRAEAARRGLHLAVENGAREITRGLRRLGGELHGAAQSVIQQPRSTDRRHDAYLAHGYSDDQARRDRLGAPPYVGGDSLRRQRRRQGLYRRRRREVSHGAKRFDSHAAVDVARSPESDEGKRRMGRRARRAVSAWPQSTLLRTLSGQQSTSRSRKTERASAASRGMGAAVLGRYQKQNHPAALPLERYRAAAARYWRTAPEVPTMAWRWNMSIR